MPRVRDHAQKRLRRRRLVIGYWRTKDQERYRKAAAKAAGKPSGTYHGLYASHPRNDFACRQ